MRQGRIVAIAVSAMSMLALLLHGGHAAAANGTLTLVTSPLPIHLTAQPGTTVSTSIRIKNNGTQTEQLKVGLMKFGAQGDLGRPQLSDRGPGDDYFNWVSFKPGTFAAPVGQWIDVKMTIKVPKTAALGYYYAVTFQRAQQESANGEKTAVNGATATLVLLEVPTGNEKRSVTVTSFTTDHKLYQYLPVSFALKVRNNGNIHLSPGGSIFIKKGDQQLAALDINQYQGSVLPNSNRIFSAKWDDGFPLYKDKMNGDKPVVKANGQPDRKLVWNTGQLGKWRFGHYTATALVTYNDGKHDVPIQAELSFWVIPWGLLAIVGGVLLLVLIGVLAMLRGVWRGVRGGKRSKRESSPNRSQSKTASNENHANHEDETSVD